MIKIGFRSPIVTNALLPRLGRFLFTTTKLGELEGYERLLKSSEREKVIAIAKQFLSETQIHPFTNSDPVSSRELVNLIDLISEKTSFPIKEVGKFHENDEFLHFKDNFTFVNLPYGRKVSQWSDRRALQQLIRDKFKKIFWGNDLVIIPGCADGQIPIEIYANSKKNDIELEIVAADYNLPAMQLGYLTMKSFGLSGDKIQWVQTDIKGKEFFNWLGSNFSFSGRHQIVTLVQPSLREKSFFDFLVQSSNLHKLKQTPTTVVMPVLLEDKDSQWYQICDGHVQRALKDSEKTKDLPQLMWNKTKYGHEMLRLDPNKRFYQPQQYFIRPESLSQIQQDAGYLDQSSQVFDEVQIKGADGKMDDPRSIHGLAERVFCIWNAVD